MIIIICIMIKLFIHDSVQYVTCKNKQLYSNRSPACAAVSALLSLICVDVYGAGITCVFHV